MPNPKLETYKSKKTGVIYDYTDADAQSKIPSNASPSNKMATASDVASRVDWSSYAILGAVNLDNAVLTEFAHNGAVEKTSTGYRVYNTQADAWSHYRRWYKLPKNTDLKLSTSVTFTSGSGQILIKGGNTLTYSSATDITASATISASGNQELSFNSGNYEYICVILTCTTGTSASGNITYGDFDIKLASDTRTGWVAPAMTNRELTEQLPLGLLEMIKLTKLWGANNANNALDIDKINNVLGYMYRIQSGTALTGTEPSGIGNGYLLIGFSGINQTSELPQYGVQIAFGFGGDKIAFRRAGYNDAGAVWGAWKYLTLT